MKKLLMCVLVLMAGCSSMAFADDDDDDDGDIEYSNLFRPWGEGTLPQKLIVTDDNAVIYKQLGKEAISVPPMAIFWRLVVDDCDDESNPVKEYGGKTYYRVGTSEGAEIGWIEDQKVSIWMTRFVLAPLPPAGDRAFNVYDRPYDMDEMSVIPEDDLEKTVLATNKEVPQGFGSFAFVMNEDDGTVTEEANIDTDAQTFKKVLIYTGPISEEGMKVVQGDKIDPDDLELDFVFVIDTTGSMGPMIDLAKKVCQNISATINKDPELKEKVHFGLVDYRDSESGHDEDLYGARVDCSLDKTYEQFLEALSDLELGNGGDGPEEVIFGLTTAVTDKKIGWHENSSKHIIILGDAPNKVTAKNGKIKTFDDLYNFSNVNIAGTDVEKAFRRICFHAIWGGDDKQAIELFQVIARNKGEMDGFSSEMKNDDLPAEFTAGLKNALDAMKGKDRGGSGPSATIANNIWALKDMLIRGSGGDKAEIKRVPGFAAALGADGTKVGTMKIMLLYDELDTFHANLASTYKKLNRFEGGGSGNVKKIFDDFIMDYVLTLTGEPEEMEQYYDQSIMQIIGDQIPVRSNTLKMKIRDVMAMTPDQRKEWIKDFKTARDSAKAILDKKDAWYETFMADEEAQKFSFVSVEDMP